MEADPKGARAVCEKCKTKIVAGNVRFDYRFKVSDKLGDQKRICKHCVKDLPIETRSRDIAQLKRWLQPGHDLAHDVAATVEAVLDELSH